MNITYAIKVKKEINNLFKIIFIYSIDQKNYILLILILSYNNRKLN